MGWCVSCPSATRSAMVSWIWWARRRFASSSGMRPSRGASHCGMAAVCATRVSPWRTAGGPKGLSQGHSRPTPRHGKRLRRIEEAEDELPALLEEPYDGGLASWLAPHVLVGNPGVLEGEPHELAPALDSGPVQELVAVPGTARSGFGSRRHAARGPNAPGPSVQPSLPRGAPRGVAAEGWSARRLPDIAPARNQRGEKRQG